MATLEMDYVLPPGQVYALVSFVGPECNQKTEKLAMKIRGVFATRAEAESHVRKLQRTEDSGSSVDIYLMDIGKWALIPPDPATIDDQQFQDTKLNELMTGYREKQVEARAKFEERKKQIKEHGLDIDKDDAVITIGGPNSQPQLTAGPSADSGSGSRAQAV